MFFWPSNTLPIRSERLKANEHAVLERRDWHRSCISYLPTDAALALGISSGKPPCRRNVDHVQASESEGNRVGALRLLARRLHPRAELAGCAGPSWSG